MLQFYLQYSYSIPRPDGAPIKSYYNGNSKIKSAKKYN